MNTPPPPGAAAEGEVLGIGTVLQRDGAAPSFCLGPVAESYPPQCGGPAIVGWDWDAVDGEESASGVTWGAYAVQGTWDGTRLTVTRPPILLALYDPMRDEPDPRLDDPRNAGDTSERRLLEIQGELHNLDLTDILTSSTMNGRLLIDVVFDDGALQRYLDGRYGKDVVVVRSALRPVEG